MFPLRARDPRPVPPPRPPREIRWRPILAAAALAYLGAVYVSRPEFLQGFAPVLPERQPGSQPVPEDILKDPAVLRKLRELREENERRYGPSAPNLQVIETPIPGDGGVTPPGVSGAARLSPADGIEPLPTDRAGAERFVGPPAPPGVSTTRTDAPSASDPHPETQKGRP